MMTARDGAVLLRFSPPFASARALDATLRRLEHDEALPVASRSLWFAVDASCVYGYLWLAEDVSIGDEALARLHSIAFDAAAPDAGAFDIGRLSVLADLPGASNGTAAPWHWVVETDVTPAAEAEFNRWYNDEHLPGLAGVQGTARATRTRQLDLQPRYHACYDLLTDRVLGSPEWLAVRHRPRGDRMRSAFRSTRRTLFKPCAAGR